MHSRLVSTFALLSLSSILGSCTSTPSEPFAGGHETTGEAERDGERRHRDRDDAVVQPTEPQRAIPECTTHDEACCPNGMPTLSGTPGNDNLSGGSSSQCILGFAGDDTLEAGSAGDWLICGPGQDHCNGDSGPDVIFGGVDRDIIDAGSGHDKVNSGHGDDEIDLGSGADECAAGSGNDEVDGASGDDTIYAGAGNDVVSGGSHSDEIHGNEGDDQLSGESGNDTLIGGPGLDIVQGGSGADIAIIHDVCELVAGESYDGGSGVDTLVTPIDLAALQAMGVTVTGFENIQIQTDICASECGLQAVQSGSDVGIVQLSRPVRTPAEVVARATSFAEALGGAPLTADPGALSWAQRAMAAPGVGAAEQDVFVEQPDLVVSYEPYEDRLTIQNRSLRLQASDLATLTEGTAPDPGIGKPAALQQMESVHRDLVESGLLEGATFHADGARRIVRGFQREDGDPGYAWVQEYIFRLHRYVCGLPVRSSLLELGIDRSGAFTYVSIGDVDIAVVGTTTAMVSETAAAQLLQSRADVETASIPGTNVLSGGLAAYFLDPDLSSASVEPRYVAKITHVNGEFVSRSQVAAVSMLDESPDFEPILPWDGASIRTPTPDGGSCSDDSQCSSGHCYVIPGLTGACGECSNDGDCVAGGCSPPNPFTLTGPTCNDGSPGSGCETDAACQEGLFCGAVGETAAGYTLRTCGECRTDDDCGTQAGVTCNPDFQLVPPRASNKCVDAGTLQNGSTCASEVACASGYCDPFIFYDGSEVGVCGECSEHEDCGPSQTCTQASFGILSGFTGTTCQPIP